VRLAIDGKEHGNYELGVERGIYIVGHLVQIPYLASDDN
jgi:hypothetical protein